MTWTHCSNRIDRETYVGFHICLQSNPGLILQVCKIRPGFKRATFIHHSSICTFLFWILTFNRRTNSQITKTSPTELQKVILARAQCAPVARSEDNVRVIYKQKTYKWAYLKITTFWRGRGCNIQQKGPPRDLLKREIAKSSLLHHLTYLITSGSS